MAKAVGGNMSRTGCAGRARASLARLLLSQLRQSWLGGAKRAFVAGRVVAFVVLAKESCVLMKNFLVTGVAVLAFGLSGVAAAQDALDRTRASGVLKVGTETAFAPFDFMDAGKHVGLNVDVFEQVGADLGVKIEWTLLPWDGVLPGLETKRFDMVAGPATISKARLERYRFTTPIAEATLALLKRKGDDALARPEDIAGKVVGAAKASAQLTQLQAYSATLSQPVDVREYPGNSEAYADLAARRLVAVANSLPNISFVAKQRSNVFEVLLPPIGPKTYFGFLGRDDEDSARLLDAVNAVLLEMKKDGRMEALQQKWFGTTFETPDAVTDPAI